MAVVSDSSIVLGLGDIGSVASLSAMGSKCALFRACGGLSAILTVLDTKNPDEIVEILARLRLMLGAVNLEDIFAPRCFETERWVVKALDYSVMYDDQHGTAIVVQTALMGVTKLLGRDMSALQVMVSCVGAAGVMCMNLLLASSVSDIIVLDSRDILYTRRDDMNCVKVNLVRRANLGGLTGSMAETLVGVDVFLGVSAGLIGEELIATMTPSEVVFALSNSDREIYFRHCRHVCSGDGHRTQQFLQPDQRRARFSWLAECRSASDHRKDDDGHGRSDLQCHQRRPRPRPDRPELRVGVVVAKAVALASKASDSAE